MRTNRFKLGLSAVLAVTLAVGLSFVDGSQPSPKVGSLAANPVLPPAAVAPAPVVRTVNATGSTAVAASTHIAEDTVWGPQGSPYVLAGDLYIDVNASLTLLPGTVVKLAGGKYGQIVVGGQLLSLGSASQHVVITSAKDDSAGGDSNGDGTASSPAAGDWYSVIVYGRSANPTNASIFDYTDFRYGGYGTAPCSAYALLWANGLGSFVVSNSVFSDSMSDGISLGGGKGRYGVYNSVFSRSGCGINADYGNADIVGNVFEASLSSASLLSHQPRKLRFWYNTVSKTILIAGVPAPTRESADVRFNQLIGGVSTFTPADQRLTDWSGNWWGYNANVLPRCIDSATASTYQPPVSTRTNAAVCPAGQVEVTGYTIGATPSLSASPQVLPGSVREAYAPRFGPVDTYSGVLHYEATDLVVEDAGKTISANRSYRSDRSGSGDAGTGWTTAFSEALSTNQGTATLSLPDGGSLPFQTDPAAGYVQAPGVAAAYTAGGQGTSVTTPGQSTYQFNAAGELTGMLLGDPGHQVDVHRTAGALDKVTGVSGRFLTYTRANGRLGQVTDSQGRTVSLSYVNGRLTSVAGVDGQAETYTYDGSGRLVKVSTPSGVALLAAGYDANGRVAWLEQAGSGRTTFTYDRASGKTTVTLANGTIIEQQYDWAGRLLTDRINGGPGRHLVYDGEGHVVADVTGVPSVPMAGYGPAAAMTQYDGHGDPVLTIDPTGVPVQTTFDAQHHPLVTTRDDGSTVSRSYDANGRPTTVVDPNGKTWRYTVNGRGQTTGQTDPLGRTRSVAYAANGDVASATDETGAVTTYTSDALGRQTRVTDPLGNRSQVSYTAWGAKATTTAPSGAATTQAYDVDRRLASVTDPTGAVTRSEYDTAGRLSSTVDALGGRTTYEFDALGRQVKTTDARGSVNQRGYTPEGWPGTATDPAGAVTTTAYDPAGHPIRVTDALGQVTQTVYDRAGRTLRVDSPDGSKRAYGYDVQGRPVSQTAPLGGVSKVTYDAIGRTITMTDPLNFTQQRGYDDAGRLVSATDQLGTVTSYVYDDARRSVTASDPLGQLGVTRRDAAGRTVSTSDATGAVTSYGYNADGRVTAVTDPAAGVVRYEYDAAGRRTAQVDQVGRRSTSSYDALSRVTGQGYPGGASVSYGYDATGNLLRRTDRVGSNWTYAYDSRGKVTIATDPLGKATTYGYDALGRVTQATDPTGVVENTAYDPLGREAVRWDAGNASWVTRYDLDGNTSSTVDPAGIAWTYTYSKRGELTSAKWGPSTTFGVYVYDAAGRLTQRKDPNQVTYTYDGRGRVSTEVDGLNRSTAHTYDAAGRLTSTTTPGAHTSNWTYDAAGRPASAADPLGDTSRYTYDASGALATLTLPRGGVYRYTYDSNGRLASETDPLGGATSSSYDAEDRVTRVTPPSGQASTAEYDAAGQLIRRTAGAEVRNFGYDAAGRPSSAAGTLGTPTLSFSYDNRGLLVRSTDTFGDTTYDYDSARRLTRRGPPSGPATTYTYDTGRGLLATVRGATNINYNSYDAGGRVTLRSGVAPSSTGTDIYIYDAAGQATKWSERGFQASAVTYQPDGQIATVSRSFTGNTTPEVTTYGYDNAGRLTSAQVNQGSTTLSSNAYTWDADGNRTSSATNGSAAVTATYNTADRLVSTSDGAAYTYNADGQLTSTVKGGATTGYAYNGFGELTGVTAPTGSATYQRDALGRMSARTAGGVVQKFGYDADSGDLAASQNSGGPLTTVARDTRGELLAMSTVGGTTARASRTIHGDIAALANDASGAITWTDKYDPFGGVTATTGTTPLSMGFQSQYTDPLSGLVDMDFRSYDPSAGRFTRADDVVGTLGSPVTLNRYLYANADPADYTDPDGHWPDWLDNLADEGRRALDWTGKKLDNGLKWVGEHKEELLAGGLTLVACEALTAGTATPLCMAGAGAVAGAVNGAKTCPEGEDRAKCILIDAAAGGVAGGAYGLLEVVGAPVWLAGALSSGAGSATEQFLSTGDVDLNQVSDAALWGGFTAGIFGLLGRGGRASRDASEVSADTAAVRASSETAPSRASSETAAIPAVSEAPPARALTDAAPSRAPSEAAPPRASSEAAPSRAPASERPGGTSCLHSFDPDTEILMADGSTKLIKDVAAGDEVASTDVTTGTAEAHAVVALHLNQDTDLTDLTVQANDGDTEVLHTTWHHPFWEQTQQKWVDAADLTVGDQLRSLDGDVVTVADVRNFTGSHEMRDLTVDTVHTYYVIAAGVPVLVHNCNLGTASSEQSVANNRAALNIHGGDGFSGVYDPATDTFHARLSGGPNALVDQYGGHGVINGEVYGGSRDTVGFAIIRNEDGALQMRWNSRSVNTRNFGDRAAPMEHRGSIMDAVRRATGLEVLG